METENEQTTAYDNAGAESQKMKESPNSLDGERERTTASRTNSAVESAKGYNHKNSADGNESEAVDGMAQAAADIVFDLDDDAVLSDDSQSLEQRSSSNLEFNSKKSLKDEYDGNRSILAKEIKRTQAAVGDSFENETNDTKPAQEKRQNEKKQSAQGVHGDCKTPSGTSTKAGANHDAACKKLQQGEPKQRIDATAQAAANFVLQLDGSDMTTTSSTNVENQVHPPGAEAIVGPSGHLTSVGTIVIGSVRKQGDPNVKSDPSDAKQLDAADDASVVLMEAELVQDKTVDAVPLDEKEFPEDYKELKRDYKTLRKRIAIVAFVVLLVVVGTVAGVVLGTRGKNGDDDDQPNGVKDPDEGDESDDIVPMIGRCTAIEMRIECVLTDDPTRSCDTIPNPERSCDGPTLALFFRYSGAACLQAASAGVSLLDCIDFYRRGPAPLMSSVSQSAFIVATDVITNEVYGARSISIGDQFSVLYGNLAPLGEATNITVYTNSSWGEHEILQTFLYQSDCTSPLSLNDKFGSFELVSFVTEEQGIVNDKKDDVNVTYTYFIANYGTDNFTFDAFAGYLHGDDFSAAELVGSTLFSGNSEQFYHTTEINLATRQSYTVNGTLVLTHEEDDVACIDTKSYQFDAGIPAQTFAPSAAISTSLPTVPSDSGEQPVSSPTIEPTLQTTSPLASLCLIDLEVTCYILDITTNSAHECEAIPPLKREQCTSRPSLMSFRFTGENCAESFHNQHSSQFQCEDFSTSSDSLSFFGGDKYTLVISDAYDAGVIYQENPNTVVGDSVSIQNDGGKIASMIRVSVYTASKDSLLQTFSFHTSCISSAPLFVADRFGSLQLTAYVNQNQGVVNTLTTATFFYTVVGIDSVPITVRNLTATIVTGDVEESVMNESSVALFDLAEKLGWVKDLEKGDRKWVEQSFSIDLSVKQEFATNATVKAHHTSGSEAKMCQHTKSLSFTVSGEVHCA